MSLKVLFVFSVICAALAVSSSPVSRISGGTPATIYDYPFVVAILYEYPRAGVIQRCVGALISSWHVLTTAYCLTDADIEKLQLRAGSAKSLEGGILTGAAELIIHPEYVATPRTADIAIILVKEYFAMSDTIRIVYIPPQETYIPDGYPVSSVSWGFESEDGDQLESLSSIKTNVISQARCSEVFADNDDVSIYDQVFCTQAEGVSMCRGDSGAPLIHGEVVVGVKSYANTCDDTTPDLFTRVDRHTGWILEYAVPPQGWMSGSSVQVASLQVE